MYGVAEAVVQVKASDMMVADAAKSEAAGVPVPDVRVSNPAKDGVLVAVSVGGILEIETVTAPPVDT